MNKGLEGLIATLEAWAEGEACNRQIAVQPATEFDYSKGYEHGFRRSIVLLTALRDQVRERQEEWRSGPPVLYEPEDIRQAHVDELDWVLTGEKEHDCEQGT